jgi:hypothetical protein
MKRIFIASKGYSTDLGTFAEPYDSNKDLSNKLDKTKKRVKTLINAMEAQSRLLKALAKKIDPSLNIEALYEDDWITPETMQDNDGEPQEFNFDLLDTPDDSKKEVVSSGVDVAF